MHFKLIIALVADTKTDVIMDAARKVAAEYPDIYFDNANIDAMGMWLLKNPLNYQVIVTTNLFGDIISDLCGRVNDRLGMNHYRKQGRRGSFEHIQQ